MGFVPRSLLCVALASLLVHCILGVTDKPPEKTLREKMQNRRFLQTEVVELTQREEPGVPVNINFNLDPAGDGTAPTRKPDAHDLHLKHTESEEEESDARRAVGEERTRRREEEELKIAALRAAPMRFDIGNKVGGLPSPLQIQGAEGAFIRRRSVSTAPQALAFFKSEKQEAIRVHESYIAADARCTNGLFDLASGTCQCDPMWEGERCESCVLHTESCNAGIAAINEAAGVCECRNCGFFTGPFCNLCEFELSANHDSCEKKGMFLHEGTCACEPLRKEVSTMEDFDHHRPSPRQPAGRGDKRTPAATVNNNSRAPLGACNLHRADCRHGTTVNVDSCSCETCPAQFAGVTCGICTLTPEGCNNHATSINSNCECECQPGWTGATCQRCHLTHDDCFHGGVLNPHTCKCESCNAPWGGDLCDQCALSHKDCKHGEMSWSECRCINCPPGWGGPDCGKCLRTAEQHCKKGVALDQKSCECACEDPKVCQQCRLKPSDCLNNSVLDTESCTCTACDGLNGWGGVLCNKCVREDAFCAHSGKMNTKTCKCEGCGAYWLGGCEICNIPEATCLNGGEMDLDLCRCKCDGLWSGDVCNVCTLDKDMCMNGSVANKVTCECECNEKWYGDFCDYCNLGDRDCTHGGKVNKDTCECVGCDKYWGGNRCDQCLRTKEMEHKGCEHGGKMDLALCECVDCASNWGGELCEVCVLDESFCKHGSKVDRKTCKCSIACPEDFQGLFCDSCVRDDTECLHGGTVEQDTCKCTACPGWKGDLCDICDKTHAACKSGEMDQKTCECTKCDSGFSGVHCDVCIYSQDSCKNGVFDEEECSCVECDYLWQGILCDECSLKDADCPGSHVVRTYGQCKCAACTGFWSGDTCGKCDLHPQLCRHAGEPDYEKCECVGCAPYWGGPICEQCIKDPKTACVHGGKLNLSTCECDQCDAPWGGPDCNTCTRLPDVCQHNGELDLETCSCKTCHGPWNGELCHLCDRERKTCQHQSVLDMNTCTCRGPSCGDATRLYTPTCGMCKLKPEDCSAADGTQPKVDLGTCTCLCDDHRWAGVLCDQCRLDHLSCARGVFDKAACKCIECPEHWSGLLCDKCDVDAPCLNGGMRDPKECTCTCGALWSGKDCSVCERKCLHGGKLDEKKCECSDCAEPWTGPGCDVCSIRCENDSEVDTETCTCKCHMPWGGRTCNTCWRRKTVCQHGSLDEATCACTCGENWEGEFCRKCSLPAKGHCLNGSTLDPATCECECRPQTTGKQCEKCMLYPNECPERSVFNHNKCRCDCLDDWTGRECNKCGLAAEDCMNNGTPDSDACKCECANQWSGPSCTVCLAQCHGKGAINHEKCSCDCEAPWTGINCDQCDVAKKSCPNGSVDPSTCECRCAKFWSKDCETCLLTPHQCNGGKVDRESCKCLCPDSQPGLMCEQCKLCQHGGVCKLGKCLCAAGWGSTDCSVPTHPAVCRTSGSVHVQTFDREYFNWYQAGEWVLYYDEKHGHKVTALIEVSPGDCNPCLAEVVGLGVMNGEGTFTLGWDSRRPGLMVWDCNEMPQATRNVDGTRLQWDGNNPRVTLPGGALVRVVNGQVEVTAYQTKRVKEEFSGLCGNFNGAAGDDFITIQPTKLSLAGIKTKWFGQPVTEALHSGLLVESLSAHQSPFCGQRIRINENQRAIHEEARKVSVMALPMAEEDSEEAVVDAKGKKPVRSHWERYLLGYPGAHTEAIRGSPATKILCMNQVLHNIDCLLPITPDSLEMRTDSNAINHCLVKLESALANKNRAARLIENCCTDMQVAYGRNAEALNSHFGACDGRPKSKCFVWSPLPAQIAAAAVRTTDA